MQDRSTSKDRNEEPPEREWPLPEREIPFPDYQKIDEFVEPERFIEEEVADEAD